MSKNTVSEARSACTTCNSRSALTSLVVLTAALGMITEWSGVTQARTMGLPMPQMPRDKQSHYIPTIHSRIDGWRPRSANSEDLPRQTKRSVVPFKGERPRPDAAGDQRQAGTSRK